MKPRDRLPPEVRRRLGRIKRAVLDQPEPPPKPAKRTRARRPKAAKAAAPMAAQLPTGVAEGGQLTRLELRRQCVLEGRHPDSSVLEIGPAHQAILPKREGYRTKTVDYLDRDGLVDKYKEHEHYDLDAIEVVDYVLPPGASMADEIPERFDIVLASHVIEHTTSLIDFLNECGKLLSPSGRVALVVPDHRFCFDRFRQRSSLGRIIDASLEPRAVHSVGTMIDFSVNAVMHRGTTAWAPRHRGVYTFVNTLENVQANARRARAQDAYIDVHNWVFSPNYLRLVLHDLATLGYINLWEETFHATVGHEFFINLSLDGGGIGTTREELLVLADSESRTLDVPTWGDQD